jgi:ATP:ADP antiporter, AAA family
VTDRRADPAVHVATLCAAMLIAHQVAAKATRQALFLSEFSVDRLLLMIMGAAAVTIPVAMLASRAMAAAGPARLVRSAFFLSGLLHLAEWILVFRFRAAVAVIFYLHFNGLGAVLISGFWSIVNEHFDPHTAKQRIGRIAGGATAGALVGGLAGWFLGAPRLMLPILCAVHLLCGWMLNRLAPAGERAGPPREAAGGFTAGTSVLARQPYLRHLALLVMLGAAGGTMIEYVFSARAQSELTQSGPLLPFFAAFYTWCSLVGWVVQWAFTGSLLGRCGLGPVAGMLPATVTLGSLGAAFLPGLGSITAARGSEQVVRNSLFRSAYELFYTSIPPKEKRSAKPLIDAGFDRLGDILGAGVGRGLLWLLPQIAQPAILAAAAGFGLAGTWIAGQLNRGYVTALEKSLRNRAVDLDLDGVTDNTTRLTLVRVMEELKLSQPPRAVHAEQPAAAPVDPVMYCIGELRSGDPVRVRRILEEGLQAPALTPHVIALLAWDAVAEDAQGALRRAGAGITGQLVDALLDGEQDFAVRRRIPRVLAAFPSSRAAEGLLLGLNDKRFEVRYRCGRALAATMERDPELPVPVDRVFAAVSRELESGRHLWEGYRLLDGLEESEMIGERANRGLEHVFTLLQLVLPKEPLKICLRALHTDDEMMRGTALEYLESVLPPRIRHELFPLIEDRRPARREHRSPEEVLAELLNSHQSIELRLRELRIRGSSAD